MLAKDYQR